MALEDAHALAAAIGEHGATEAALRAYEAARVPRISHISNVVMVRPIAALGLFELRSASVDSASTCRMHCLACLCQLYVYWRL